MKSNKLWLVIGAFLLLGIGIVVAGVLLSGDSTISLDKADKDTLATKGVTNPNVSELVCDGEICRSCARQQINENVSYGMGCISIAQTYCSSYNETLDGNNETTGECLSYTEYSDAELKTNRDEAYKTRWEGIADAIRQRDARVEETKVDEGEVTINAK